MENRNANVNHNGKCLEQKGQATIKMNRESLIKLLFQSDDVLLAYIIAQYATNASNQQINGASQKGQVLQDVSQYIDLKSMYFSAKIEKFRSQALRFGVDLSEDKTKQKEETAKIIKSLLDEIIEQAISQIKPITIINLPNFPTQKSIDEIYNIEFHCQLNNLEETATFERPEEIQSTQVQIFSLNLEDTTLFVRLSTQKEVQTDWKDIIIEIKNGHQSEIQPKNKQAQTDINTVDQQQVVTNLNETSQNSVQNMQNPQKLTNKSQKDNKKSPQVNSSPVLQEFQNVSESKETVAESINESKMAKNNKDSKKETVEGHRKLVKKLNSDVTEQIIDSSLRITDQVDKKHLNQQNNTDDWEHISPVTKKSQLSTQHKQENLDRMLDKSHTNKRRSVTYKCEGEAIDGSLNEQTDNSDPFIVAHPIDQNGQEDESSQFQISQDRAEQSKPQSPYVKFEKMITDDQRYEHEEQDNLSKSLIIPILKNKNRISDLQVGSVAPSDTRSTQTPSKSILSGLRAHIKEQVDEKTGTIVILKKKKGKGRARVSINSQVDGQSTGPLSNKEIEDMKNIFQQGIRQKMVQGNKNKKKKTTVVNETPQEQEKKIKQQVKEKKKKRIMHDMDLWDLGL